MSMDEIVRRVLDAYGEEGLEEFLFELEAMCEEELFLKIMEELGFYYEERDTE